MQSIWGISAKALALLLAALVVAQPALALDCPCNCPASTASCGEAKPVEDKPHACKHKKCCQKAANREQRLAKHAPEVPDKQSCARRQVVQFGGRPCQCPSDCECQLRHEQQIGATEIAKVQVDHDVAGVPLDCVALEHTIGSCDTPSDQKATYSLQRTSALEICALFCRFSA